MADLHWASLIAISALALSVIYIFFKFLANPLLNWIQNSIRKDLTRSPVRLSLKYRNAGQNEGMSPISSLYLM